MDDADATEGKEPSKHNGTTQTGIDADGQAEENTSRAQHTQMDTNMHYMKTNHHTRTHKQSYYREPD